MKTIALLFLLALASLVQATDYNLSDLRFGVKGDARKVTDAVLNGTTTVTSASANFTNADRGKIVWGVEAASPAGHLRLGLRVINAVNSESSITVSGTSYGVGNYSGIHLVFGTDQSDEIAAAVAVCKADAHKGRLVIPAGGYVFSRLLFDLNSDVGAEGMTICGAGSSSTVFYLSPAYDFGTTATGRGLLWSVQNLRHSMLEGVLVDGSYLNLDAGGYHALYDGGAATYLKDVRVQRMVCNSGLLTGSQSKYENVRVEACSYAGISTTGGASCAFTNSYSGNCGYVSVFVYNATGGSTNTGSGFEWYGGTVDESTGGSLLVQSSTDVFFHGALIFGAGGCYGGKLTSNSTAHFIGCRILSYTTTGNRGGLQVESGSTAWLTGCRVAGAGTLPGLDNAGTVFDGLNNTISSQSGTPPKVRIITDHLPASDPGVPGQMYHDSGVLKISL